MYTPTHTYSQGEEGVLGSVAKGQPDWDRDRVYQGLRHGARGGLGCDGIPQVYLYIFF